MFIKGANNLSELVYEGLAILQANNTWWMQITPDGKFIFNPEMIKALVQAMKEEWEKKAGPTQSTKPSE